VGRGDGALTAPTWLRWSWLLPVCFLSAFLVYPLVRVVARSGADPSALASPEIWRVATLAVGQAAVSTVLALLIGLPVANVATRYRFRGRAAVLALATVPFVLPTVVVALALRSVVGPVTGLWIVVLAHAYVNLAVVVRVVGAQWAHIDARRVDVARTLGATRWSAFRSVTLPDLRPSLISSATVVFVFSFTSLGIVLLLGDSGTRTLETQILRQTSLLLDFPAAAATAIVQLVVVSVALGVGAALAARTTRTAPVRPELRVASTRSGRWGVALTAIGAVAVVLLPVVALVLRSFSPGWTTEWWRQVLAGPAREVLVTSLGYALVTAVVAGIVGGLAATAVLSSGVGRWIAAAAAVPLGVSAATLGLGLLLAFGRGGWDLRGTALLVPLAHSLVAVPLVVAVAAPALRAADARRVAVAATLGARPTRAFLTAYGTILRAVVFAAGALAAAVSLGEFGAASFLVRDGGPTVPVEIVRLLGRPGEANAGMAAALAVVLVALTTVLVLAADRLGRRSSS
jgi:thiamine transport system permease protein